MRLFARVRDVLLDDPDLLPSAADVKTHLGLNASYVAWAEETTYVPYGGEETIAAHMGDIDALLADRGEPALFGTALIGEVANAAFGLPPPPPLPSEPT